MSIPLVILAGPTGVGKTEIALKLAEHLHAEIVGADSMQIYRFMDIGTAKPTPEERLRVPHHLIDIRNPDEEYSAADYARDATRAIRDIDVRGRLPLLVGGTGLYIQAVVYGIFEGPGRDETYREHLRELAEEYGNLALYQKLETVDPLSAHRLHPNDLVRVIRALEVFHLTGITISAYQATATTPLAGFTPCFLALTAERETLYERIETRVDAMIAAGLVGEVERLLQQGYHAELNAMKSLGYKEIVAFLLGQTDLPTAITQIKHNSRRYAKRQLTWFRKYQNILWVQRTPDMTSAQIAAQYLEHIEMWRANL